MEMESLSLNAGIALIVAVSVLFVLVIVLAVMAYRNWKQVVQKGVVMSEDIGKLKETTASTDDALKQTNKELAAVTDEVRQNDDLWKKHQANMLAARHQVFISNMSDRIDGMIEEVKINATRGVLDDKTAACYETSYTAAKVVIKNMSNLKS